MSGFNETVLQAAIQFLEREYGIVPGSPDFNSVLMEAAQQYLDDPVSSSWGDPIDSWEYSSPVPSVDFTDLGEYRDLMLWVESLTSDVGSTTQLYLRTSTDNGASFAFNSGDYDNVGSASTGGMIIGPSVAAATPQLGTALIYEFNDPLHRTNVHALAGPLGSANAIPKLCQRTVAEVNNALRVSWTVTANFTGGRMRLYGRRG